MLFVGSTQKIVEETNQIGTQKDIISHMDASVGRDKKDSHAQIKGMHERL